MRTTELFIGGDPRLLAGSAGAQHTNYESSPVALPDGRRMATDDLCDGGGTVQDRFLKAADAKALGVAIHSGKSSYHSTPPYNLYLRTNEWPSAGIELETNLRVPDDGFASRAMRDLWSNWFHFERDGSLDPVHGGRFGYELITEPLPPRAYRNPELWMQLRNLVSPWLKSYECPETGLHVHVGLNQFECIDMPVTGAPQRRALGKLLSGMVYYSVAGQPFVDRVCLRKQTSYCAQEYFTPFTDAIPMIESGQATGAALVDYAVAKFAGMLPCDYVGYCRGSMSGAQDFITKNCLPCGHGTEINCGHSQTVEFRRGKGTTHALSIHRIVELMTGIVRFAGKICREPGFKVTRRSFMEWLAETTTSEALRNLAKENMECA